VFAWERGRRGRVDLLAMERSRSHGLQLTLEMKRLQGADEPRETYCQCDMWSMLAAQ